VLVSQRHKVWVVLFTLCIMSLNFHWSKSGMSCSPAVMYSVCKSDISETFKSEPGYALLAIIPSEHTQQRIWQKVATLAHFRVLFVAVRMFTRHTLDVHHKQSQQVMDFSLFLLALYLSWGNFLNSEMTREQHNKENTLLIAENINTSTVAWFQATNAA